MNQVKYILSACLILMLISVAIFLYKSLPDSGIIGATGTDSNFLPNEKGMQTTVAKFSLPEMQGENLFKKHCIKCHAIGATDNILDGFENRGPWKDRRELYRWIRDPQQYMLQDRTGYTKGLKQKYGVSMLATPELADRDIDKMINYLIKANRP